MLWCSIASLSLSLLLCFYSVCKFLDFITNPHGSSCAIGIISFSEHIDSTILSKTFNLLESFFVSGWIYRKGCSAAPFYNGECGNVTWSICDIDHISKVYSTLIIR